MSRPKPLSAEELLMEQELLLEPPAKSGEQLKQEGMAQAAASMDPVWRADVMRVVAEVASVKAQFTADDIREEAERQGIGEPKHANQWGTVLSSAAKQGICHETTQCVKSKQPQRHSGLIKVWQSAIVQGD